MFSNMMCDQFNWPGYRLYLLLLGQHAGPKMINLLSGHPMSRSDSNVNISLAKFKMPTIIYKPSEMFCIVVVRANCRHQLLPHFQYRGQTIGNFFFKRRRFSPKKSEFRKKMNFVYFPKSSSKWQKSLGVHLQFCLIWKQFIH